MIDLRTVARALGGEVHGQQVLAPGPGHSRRDRSLSVRMSHQSPGGFITHSHCGDRFDACRDHVLQRLGLPIDAWRTRVDAPHRPAPTFAAIEPGVEPDRAARIARAAALWAEAGDAHGTVVEVYLKGRGLELPPGAEALRYHPRCPWRDAASGEMMRIPAVVAAMRAVEGDDVTAIHRTRLTPEGIKLDRRMLSVTAGAAIKLDADAAVTLGLAVGEGAETALAARQLGFCPAWALASAGAVAAFPVIPGVEALTLLAERDDASARAVEACAARWHAAGREVTVVEPKTGSDMADLIRGAA